MSCQRCGSQRVLHVQSKGDDCQGWSMNGKDGVGYLPYDFGLGGGDDLEVSVCLDCGQAQGQWPLPKSEFEMEDEDE